MPDLSLTPTQDKMFALLSDGLPHSNADLKSCLDDELAGHSALTAMLTLMRQRLRRSGYGILCERDGNGGSYRLVRFIQKD